MIDVTENNKESLSDVLHQGNQINSKDLNNLCHIFLELLEASLCIQYELCKVATHQDSMHLKILSEGFDQIIKQQHHNFLEIKKQNQWDSNIGEELI